MREHLESVQKQTGKTPKELAGLIEMPDSLKEYWNWFIRLNNRRPSGMGLSVIPYSEMKAFFDMLGVNPETYELEIIEMFDHIAISILSEQMQKEQKRQSKSKGNRS